MDIKDYIFLPNELDNPEAWYRKAGIYSSASYYLLKKHQEELVDGAKIDDVSSLISAISVTPCLTAFALELYMKGYLKSFGVDTKTIFRFQHDIEGLRRECLKYSSAWDNEAITFVCDQ